MNNSLTIPSYGQKNFAPLQPLLSLREPQSPREHYLCDALKERFQHFYNLEKSVWREIFSVMQLIALFTEGKQILLPNPHNGSWRPVPISGNDAKSKRAVNIMQFYTTNCITKWMLSNPDVRAMPGRDTDQAVASARGAGIVADHYEGKFFTPWFNYQEGLLGLQGGTYLNCFRHDDRKKGATGLRDILGEREVKMGEGFGFCADCKTSGAYDHFIPKPDPAMAEAGMMAEGGMPDAGSLQNAENPLSALQQSVTRGMPTCPSCSSLSVAVEPPPMQIIPIVTGQEEVQMGEIVCEQIPLPSCRWDLRRRAEESTWFIHRQRTNLSSIRRLLGNIRVPDGEGQTDIGLDILDALAHSGQAMAGTSAHGDRKSSALYQQQVNLEEMWLGPDDYADIELKGNEETVSGQKFEKSRLVDLFPDGLVAVGLNGMSVVLGLYPERHSDHIVSGVWHMKSLSGAGRPGMADTVEPQKRLNTFDTKAMKYWASTATPAVLFNQDLLQSDEARYLGHEEANIPVDMSRIPNLTRLQDAVHQLPPGTMPGQFLEYTYQRLNEFAQLTSHVTDFTAGLPGVENDTATGARITAANSNALFTPPLQIKGEVRKRGAEITVELFRKHFPLKRYFPLGGRFGRQQGVWLAGADLSTDVIFSVVRDSELPKDIVSEQQERIAFYALFGGFTGYLQLRNQFPEDVAELERLWNIQRDGQDFDEVGALCRKRLEQMKQGLRLGVMDIKILLAQIKPPVSPREPKHRMKAEWWQELLDEDEGQDAPPLLRMAMEFMVDAHFAMAGMQEATVAMQQGGIQMAGAAPGALAGNLLNPAPQPGAKR